MALRPAPIVGASTRTHRVDPVWSGNMTSVTRQAEPSLTTMLTRLRGRRAESEMVDQLLDRVRAGRSAACVIRGEPGIGKTALLEYAIESASDLKVLRAVGVESELELAFAALH